MSYRPLEKNDRVKIMEKGFIAFGTFGTVVSVSGEHADVKMGDSSRWFLQKDLMVAHDALHGFYTDRTYYMDISQYKKQVDSDVVCKYDDWDRDDLIEKIRELEMQIESMEERVHNL